MNALTLLSETLVVVYKHLPKGYSKKTRETLAKTEISKEEPEKRMNTQRLLDLAGWRLVEALQENARMSYQELGQRVGLSPVAVAERVRRLEEVGIITGYRAEIDAPAVGLPSMAFIRMVIAPEKWTRFVIAVREMKEVHECHRVLGEDSFILRIRVASMRQLEQLIDRLASYGQPTTSLVLSSAIVRRSIEQASVNKDEADDIGQPS